MRRLVSVIAIVCMATFCMIIVAEANVILVPEEHKTIQAALKVAKKGDTVLVAEGEYREEITLKDGVTLQGAGEKSILKLSVKALSVTDAVITGFAMKGGTINDHSGILCSNAKVTIENMTIWGFHHAITVATSRVILKNNIIANSFSVGISVTASEALIEENQLLENPSPGMIISNSDRKILVSNNTIKKNRYGIQCDDASPIIRRNLITQNTFGISIDNAQPNLGTTSDPGLNIIYDNKEGDVINSGERVVFAQQNYWGNPDGPCADCISGRVEYKPWLRQKSPGGKQSVRPKANSPIIWGWLKNRLELLTVEIH